ncbi:MAG: spore coat associated protein CotJA [Defluviitaleaceae bacterium]|nr:spore coat associated protein CotJA [Defluviitaleaceae bacterium]
MTNAVRTNDDCKDYVPKMKFIGFGRAYVPRQKLCELFSAKDGFVAGTIFPELHIPYHGRHAHAHSQNIERKEGENLDDNSNA